MLQVGLIDPGHFRTIEEIITGPTKGHAKIEVMSLKEDVSDLGELSLM